MSDPRESKLPKWARDLLHLERMKAVVRFPDEPPPEPDIHETIGHSRNAPRNTWIYSENDTHVFAHYVRENGYLSRGPRDNVGRQVRGDYYLSLDDARLAHRWRVCRKAAEMILTAETKELKQ